jgi:hypothetical protein
MPGGKPMWRNISKKEKENKKRVFKYTRCILDKKILNSKDVKLSIDKQTPKSLFKDLNRTFRELGHASSIYYVWRQNGVPWWFGTGRFHELYHTDDLKRPKSKKSLERLKRINKLKLLFTKAKPLPFVIVVYKYKDNILILDGNHRLSALVALKKYDYPLTMVELIMGRDTADRLCPDMYVFHKFIEGGLDTWT